MAKKSAAPRVLRADAQRNRDRVLEVAQAVFATEGLGVPIDEIARRAGLGIGTLYRHFPTKAALFAAIVHERMVRLADQAEALADDADPDRAFFELVELLAVEMQRKKDLGQAITGIDMQEVTADSKARLRAAFTRLLERAQKAGAVRAGLAYDDVLALVSAIQPSPYRAAASPARILTVIRDGLRPPAQRVRKR
ncbi:MAG TPA: helix-turn-helix domain-containing protein [Kofleriaceae bacterium]|nr:helix-turn-helix domain-containing protein [Kofleriaceae bacterium]